MYGWMDKWRWTGDYQWKNPSCVCSWTMHRVPPSFHYYLEQSLLVAWNVVGIWDLWGQESIVSRVPLIVMASFTWQNHRLSCVIPTPRNDCKEWTLSGVIIRVTFWSTAKRIKFDPIGSVEMLLGHLVSRFKERLVAYNSFYFFALFPVCNIFRPPA